MFLRNLFRKCFLVKEIVSRNGEVHFQRYRLLQLPFFAVYIHYIAKSDEDKHPHNHPWNFTSIILKGGYKETVWHKNMLKKLPENEEALWTKKYIRTIWNNIINDRYAGDYHKIELIKPTWTLVFTGRRLNDDWGYLTETGFKNHIEYRKEKNAEQI